MIKGLRYFYLLVSLCVAAASALLGLSIILQAPFFNWQILVDTNTYGEGLLEFLIAGSFLPGVVIILFRAMTNRKVFGEST